MKSDTAPGPNGSNVTFFKKMWQTNQKGNLGDGSGFQWKQVGPEKTKLWSDHFSSQGKGG
jgi:hypothetical protein